MQRGSQLSQKRVGALCRILTEVRARELTKLDQLRRNHQEIASTSESDELDVARSATDEAIDVNLFELAQNQLQAIDAAFRKCEEGGYGLCEDCGGEIAVDRLEAVPFTAVCVECQRQRERGAAGRVGSALTGPWGNSPIRPSAFEPDEQEELAQRPVIRRRGRPRKVAA